MWYGCVDNLEQFFVLLKNLVLHLLGHVNDLDDILPLQAIALRLKRNLALCYSHIFEWTVWNDNFQNFVLKLSEFFYYVTQRVDTTIILRLKCKCLLILRILLLIAEQLLKLTICKDDALVLKKADSLMDVIDDLLCQWLSGLLFIQLSNFESEALYLSEIHI